MSVRGTAIVLAVFASGVLFGVALSRHVERRGPFGFERGEGQGMERMLLGAIDRHVGLDDAQRERVAAILREGHGERRAILRPLEPALEELRRRNESRIRAILREDQRPAFDVFARRMAERHARGWPPGAPPFEPPPGPPPPFEPPPGAPPP
jgi:hypothetical protein